MAAGHATSEATIAVVAAYSSASTLLRIRREATKYPVHASRASTAMLSPWTLQSGSPEAPKMTSALPARPTTAHLVAPRATRSPSRGAEMRITRAGWRAPITVALATVVSFTAEKNRIRSSPRKTPPGIPRRTVDQVRRRPVRYTMLTRATAPTDDRYAARAIPPMSTALAATPVMPQATMAADRATIADRRLFTWSGERW